MVVITGYGLTMCARAGRARVDQNPTAAMHAQLMVAATAAQPNIQHAAGMLIGQTMMLNAIVNMLTAQTMPDAAEMVSRKVMVYLLGLLRCGLQCMNESYGVR